MLRKRHPILYVKFYLQEAGAGIKREKLLIVFYVILLYIYLGKDNFILFNFCLI